MRVRLPCLLGNQSLQLFFFVNRDLLRAHVSSGINKTSSNSAATEENVEYQQDINKSVSVQSTIP